MRDVSKMLHIMLNNVHIMLDTYVHIIAHYAKHVHNVAR